MALGMLANIPKTFNISPKDKEKIALISDWKRKISAEGKQFALLNKCIECLPLNPWR